VFVDAFLLRAAAQVGFEVATDHCVVCRQPGPQAFLSVKAGGTLCPDCAPPGARAVDSGVVEVLRILLAPGEWAALVALPRQHPEAHRTAASYARAFTEHHLDRRLRSYPTLPRDGAPGSVS